MFSWDTTPATSPFGAVLTPLPDSGIVDFTHPEAYAWWRDAHQPLFEAGVDVIKSDFGEQVPEDAVAHNGDAGPAAAQRLSASLQPLRVRGEARNLGPEGARSSGPRRLGGPQRYPLGGAATRKATGRGSRHRSAVAVVGGSGNPWYATDIGGFYGGSSRTRAVRALVPGGGVRLAHALARHR